MLTLSPLDLLFLILAIILLPIGTLLTMILWRFYRMLDHIEVILAFAVKVTRLLEHIEKIPFMIIDKLLGKR